MANIVSSISKMNDQEIASDAPLSQALMLKIGSNINGLIDRGARKVEFKTAGTFSWTSPADVTQVTLLGCGGGGGGASGGINGGSNSLVNPQAGAGGLGNIPLSATLAVQPSTSYTVTIGAGGAGGTVAGSAPVNGSAGGNTSFAGLVNFQGAPGGLASSNTNAVAASTPIYFTVGGGPVNQAGAATVSASGGAAGATSGSVGQGGGGGGAGIGAGGAGGAGSRYAPAGVGVVGGQSAGGGGGGQVFDDRSNATYTPATGGQGGAGYLLITY